MYERERKRGMQVVLNLVVETDGERRETDRRERKRNRVGEIHRVERKMGGRKKNCQKHNQRMHAEVSTPPNFFIFHPEAANPLQNPHDYNIS